MLHFLHLESKTLYQQNCYDSLYCGGLQQTCSISKDREGFPEKVTIKVVKEADSDPCR